MNANGQRTETTPTASEKNLEVKNLALDVLAINDVNRKIETRLLLIVV